MANRSNAAAVGSDPLRTPSPMGPPTTEMLLEAQNQAIGEQDRMLDQMHANILEVRGVSTAIREEVTLHTSLIDDIQDGVERGLSGSLRGQETFNLVEYRSDTKALHSLICLLAFIFLVLLVFKSG